MLLQRRSRKLKLRATVKLLLRPWHLLKPLQHNRWVKSWLTPSSMSIQCKVCPLQLWGFVQVLCVGEAAVNRAFADAVLSHSHVYKELLQPPQLQEQIMPAPMRRDVCQTNLSMSCAVWHYSVASLVKEMFCVFKLMSLGSEVILQEVV